MVVSKLFYKIAKHAVRELAQNPRIQAEATKVIKERIIPNAKAGWQKAKPKLSEARTVALTASNEVAKAAAENNPRKDPKKFISGAAERLRNMRETPTNKRKS